jgi:hypothetical protein
VRESGLGSAFLIVRFEWSELREDLDCYLVMEEVTEELCGRMRWGLFCWRWVGLLLGLRREGHCSTTCVKGFVGGGMKADAGAAEESLIVVGFDKDKSVCFRISVVYSLRPQRRLYLYLGAISECNKCLDVIAPARYVSS